MTFPSALEAAIAERDALRSDIEAKQKRLAALETVIEILPTIGVGTISRGASETASQAVDDKPDGMSARQKNQAIVEKAVEVIRKTGPLQTSDLLPHIKHEGFEIESVQKLSQLLSRNGDKFVADRSKGWSLREIKTDTAVEIWVLNGGEYTKNDYQIDARGWRNHS